MPNEDQDSAYPPSDDITVFMIRRDTECAECKAALSSGNMLRIDKGRALCLECADLDWLEFLPSGNAAVSRRAKKYSPVSAIVLRWASARKRYERQGILADPAAIARAEQESLADADVRERTRIRSELRRSEEDAKYIEDFAAAVRRQFPGCPAGEETHIAAHACRKHSGRVGRTAAAKEFDAEMIKVAVIAHVRHAHTNYDQLLGTSGDRDAARGRVMGKVMEIVGKWETELGQ